MDNPKKPWYASKKIIILIVIVVLAIIGQFTNSSDKVENQPVAEKEYVGAENIKNLTFYDEEDKVWYWGVSFTTNQKSGTKLYCDVTGLDKNMLSLVGEKHEYNVANDGFTVRYGTDNLPTTDKDKAELLDNFIIGCEKL